MSADLFDKRFYSHRLPAWHQLGIVSDTARTASEALTLIGDYSVTLEPVAVPTVGLSSFGSHAIVRHPVTDDNEYRVFGIVSGLYTLITPSEMAQIWDVATGATVETVGALRKGEELFISTKLPTINVAGDEVENYLLATNSMTGKASAACRVTPVRVVCTNTLALSKQRVVESYTIPHNAQARARMTEWLRDAYGRSVAKVSTVATMFTLMAGVRATQEMVRAVSFAAYPDPKKVDRDAPAEIVAGREKLAETARAFAQDGRDRIGTLFNGAGTGMDTVAAAGTVWGLYNAVTEAENYRRMRGVASSSYDVLFGDRAETMARAFDVALRCAEAPDDVPVPFALAFA